MNKNILQKSIAVILILTILAFLGVTISFINSMKGDRLLINEYEQFANKYISANYGNSIKLARVKYNWFKVPYYYFEMKDNNNRIYKVAINTDENNQPSISYDQYVCEPIENNINKKLIKELNESGETFDSMQIKFQLGIDMQNKILMLDANKKNAFDKILLDSYNEVESIRISYKENKNIDENKINDKLEKVKNAIKKANVKVVTGNMVYVDISINNEIKTYTLNLK